LVETSRAESFFKEQDNMLFYETSAKDATNVNVAFNEIAHKAMESQEKINL